MPSAPSPTRPEPTISYQFVTALTHAIGGQQAVIEDGLAHFELSNLDPATSRISLRRYVALFEWLADALQRPYLGLELAERGGPETLGAVSYMFMGSRDLETALRNLGHYLLAVQEGSRFYLEVDGEYAFVDYSVLDNRISRRRQDSEYSLGYTWRLMQLFSANSCRLTMVEFEHEQYKKADAPFRRVFHAPVLFRRRANRLHFRTDLLQTRSRSGDPFLFPILEAHVQASIAEVARIESFADQVRAQLTHEALAQSLRAREIANRLGVSEATLHRRLRCEGTSFKKISDEAAKSLASLLIAQRSLSVSAIASRLGYSETAALTRAFHRWFGMSPRQYRKRES